MKPIPDRVQLQRASHARSATRSGSQSAQPASGSCIGMLLPATRIEDEKLGAAGDKVGEVAREGWEHGKQVAQESAEGAMEAAKESASRHSDELSSSLQDRLPSGEQTAASPSGKNSSSRRRHPVVGGRRCAAVASVRRASPRRASLTRGANDDSSS